MKHIGIYLSNKSNKTEIIKAITNKKLLDELINITGLKCAIHSTVTIDQIVTEEIKHDYFLIQTNKNQGLNTMSSGEQKKALLTHLVKQQPDVLILDDIYGNIDAETQAGIEPLINNLSSKIHIIQIFYRKKDILSVINQVIYIDENNEITKTESANLFRKSNITDKTYKHQFNLPEIFIEKEKDFDTLVKFDSVSINYEERKVLNNINWTIKPGEFWQLKGQNGTGKSTILTLITGDNPKAYGQKLFLFGKQKGTGESIWDIKRQIGYFTPGMLNSFKHVDSVENMIISGLMDTIGLYKKPTEFQIRTARNWIQILGKEYLNKNFLQLSLGQQRMVMVARALVKHPLLLILDEPTIELDDYNSAIFMSLIKAIAAEKRVAIIYVSHREEPELTPEKTFKLIPGENGSTGIII